jgi:hypothetical protein
MPHAAAEAGAVHHRDGRLGKLVQQLHRTRTVAIEAA